MRHAGGLLLAALGVLTVLAGCAHRNGPSRKATAEPMLPTAQRGSVEASISSLPTAPSRDAAASPDPFPAPAYRALTASEAQCRAVAAAPGADLHVAEASLAGRGAIKVVKNDRAAELRRDILVYAALELQNRSAGAALEAYYRLAEAEGKSELLDQGISQLQTAVRETRDMTVQKLTPPVGLDVWMRQLLSTQGDRLKAQQSIDELNGDLRRLLKLSDCGERWRVWNPEGYSVSDEPIDIEAAVCEALARRAELQMLRQLARDLGPQTLPVVRDAIRAVHPLLGAGGCDKLAGKLAFLLVVDPAARREIETRRRQLVELLHEREVAVAEEVREAASALRYQGRIVALAREREQSWKEKVRDVRARQQQGLTSFVEVAQVNLDWLKARADLIQEIMAWQVTRVKLKQAQGLLVAECNCLDVRGVQVSAP